MMMEKLTLDVAMNNLEAVAAMAPVQNPKERRILIESIDLVTGTLQDLIKKINEVEASKTAVDTELVK